MSAGRSANGGNGDRDSRGRFVKGCKPGPGAPLAGTVAKLRAELVNAITADDIREIARQMIRAARGGDLDAVRTLLKWALGEPAPLDVLERIERLETALASEGTHANP